MTRGSCAGVSSETHGYCAGSGSAVIDNFAFASEGNHADVGDMGNAIGYQTAATQY